MAVAGTAAVAAAAAAAAAEAATGGQSARAAATRHGSDFLCGCGGGCGGVLPCTSSSSEERALGAPLLPDRRRSRPASTGGSHISIIHISIINHFHMVLHLLFPNIAL